MSMTESEAKRFADAYHDCKLVADSIVDDETFQKADSGLVLVYMREILEALSEIQQYREYREIFESHFTEDALKLFSDKEEFSKWFERGKWHVLKCDELGREVEEYRAIGTVSDFRELKEKATAKRKCPNCNELLSDEYRFCPTCRRKVDWSEGKE